MNSLIQLIDSAFVTHAFYARIKRLTDAERYIILRIIILTITSYLHVLL